MKEQLVSLEVAKLLKEKRFDGTSFYTMLEKILFMITVFTYTYLR